MKITEEINHDLSKLSQCEKKPYKKLPENISTSNKGNKKMNKTIKIILILVITIIVLVGGFILYNYVEYKIQESNKDGYINGLLYTSQSEKIVFNDNGKLVEVPIQDICNRIAYSIEKEVKNKNE